MKRTFLLFIIIAVACSPKQKLSKTGSNEYNNQELGITLLDEENITFTIKNLSSETLIIFEPKRINIEKFEGGKWELIRILACPCDAPCNPPIDRIELVSGDSYNLVWNKKESWCGEKNEMGIKKTERQSVRDGVYRIRVVFGNDIKDRNVLYKEFEIK